MASTEVLPPYVTLNVQLNIPSSSPSGYESGLDTAALFRRTRASKPKVRTGCLTCKLRRVKCDEGKPTCQRCKSAGRKCDGYPQPIIQKKSENDPAMVLLLRRTPDFHCGTDDEVRSLEFFYRRTAPQLASYFDAEFWTRLIFQVQASEGAIRHAMIALGSLAKQQGRNPERVSYARRVATKRVFDTPDPNRMNLPLIQLSQDREEKFALMHYNKAICELASRMSRPDAPIEIVLLSCILFVSLEFLRGQMHPALKHFRGGMTVALSSLSQKGFIGPIAMERIEQNLLPFFNRLELLSTLLGFDADWEYNVSLENAVPKSFANMRQARDSLVHVMNLAVRFIRTNRFRRYQWQYIPAEKAAQQDELQKQVVKWQQVFGTFVTSESFTALDLDAAKVLRLHHIISTFWLGFCLRRDEVKCDEWNPLFEQAVELGDAISRSMAYSEDSSSPNFLFEMEIVSPLWAVIIKCRHPVIRRRALNVLRRDVRREGLWDSQVASAVGERVMLLEEKNLALLDGSELPLECDRIHASHINSGPVTNSDTQTHIVTHFYKPNGLDEPWESLYEEIHLARSEEIFTI